MLCHIKHLANVEFLSTKSESYGPYNRHLALDTQPEEETKQSP